MIPDLTEQQLREHREEQRRLCDVGIAARVRVHSDHPLFGHSISPRHKMYYDADGETRVREYGAADDS